MFADRTIQVGLGRQNEMLKEKERNPLWGPAYFKKRRYPRFSINLPVIYRQNKNFKSKPCHAVDISKGGLQLNVSEKIEVGQNLKLKIFIDARLESNSIETDVQVVWKGINPQGSGYRMGVRFVDISSSSPLLVLVKGSRYLGELKDKYNNEIDSKLARAYQVLGKIYMYKDDHNHAIFYFHKSIEADPNQGEAYFYRGFTYYRKGVYGKSWEDILKARELGFRVPQEFLKNLNKASGGSEEFLDHFNKGLEGGERSAALSIPETKNLAAKNDEFVKRRHSGGNRSPEISLLFERTGFRLLPE
jgi:tetratricopeptide (TPR) repeat protein